MCAIQFGISCVKQRNTAGKPSRYTMRWGGSCSCVGVAVVLPPRWVAIRGGSTTVAPTPYTMVDIVDGTLRGRRIVVTPIFDFLLLLLLLVFLFPQRFVLLVFLVFLVILGVCFDYFFRLVVGIKEVGIKGTA